MRLPSPAVCIAWLFGFSCATVLLFVFFSKESSTNAQTAPLYQQQRSAPNSVPIPENRSMLPRPEESPLYIKRYGELTPEERGSIQIYERCNKSVVNVDTRTTYNVFLLGELDEPGAGSGIVLDKEGHILTNSHVVNRVDSVTVTLYNGESYPAELIGEDIITDLAVVKIKAPADTLFPAVMSNSSDLLVGQKVFAIGNPYGLERTFTSGLISSLNRSIPSKIEARSIKGVIQIDAAINPGNSGGILLDSQGRMIGINTAIASHSGGSDGIGFAIPANTVSRIVPQLLKSGKVVRGNIGIMKVREVERDKVKGLLVISMMPDGAAEKAGLQGPKVTKERALFRGSIVVEQPKIDMRAADIITGVNGIPVKKADDFTAVVDEHKPGDQMILDVLRKGKQIQVPITLE